MAGNTGLQDMHTKLNLTCLPKTWGLEQEYWKSLYLPNTAVIYLFIYLFIYLLIGGMPAAAEPEIPQDVSISDELLMNFQRLRRGSSPDLPATVTKLETAEGCKVYLVGTAHFSKESQDDVEKVCLMCFIQGNQQGFKAASTLYMHMLQLQWFY